MAGIYQHKPPKTTGNPTIIKDKPTKLVVKTIRPGMVDVPIAKTIIISLRKNNPISPEIILATPIKRIEEVTIISLSISSNTIMVITSIIVDHQIIIGDSRRIIIVRKSQKLNFKEESLTEMMVLSHIH